MKPIVKKVLAGIAVVSALASVVAGRELSTPQRAEPVARVDTRLATLAGNDIDLSKLEARAQANEEGAKTDAFAPRNFSPIVPAREQGAAKHVAPPLPFRYIGKMLDGDKLAIFLANGNDSFAVKAGERVGDYRIDKVTDTEVVFTYLPLKTKQTLTLG
jgi:hypothetical protein